jgi:DNA-binding transcriptional ArsR family regulator
LPSPRRTGRRRGLRDLGKGREWAGDGQLRINRYDLPTRVLSADAGLPVGAVGNHLRVLLDAGVVARRRSGRNVLYWRTALGEAMIAADGS